MTRPPRGGGGGGFVHGFHQALCVTDPKRNNMAWSIQKPGHSFAGHLRIGSLKLYPLFISGVLVKGNDHPMRNAAS
jgi:hypothetical protein